MSYIFNTKPVGYTTRAGTHMGHLHQRRLTNLGNGKSVYQNQWECCQAILKFCPSCFGLERTCSRRCWKMVRIGWGSWLGWDVRNEEFWVENKKEFLPPPPPSSPPFHLPSTSHRHLPPIRPSKSSPLHSVPTCTPAYIMVTAYTMGLPPLP